MCNKYNCGKPEEKKPCEKGEVDPKNCTPEQIKKCHGDSPNHPCEEN